MPEVNVPNFGELLSPFISAVPEQAVPNFLALLERGAAQRYRDWAEQLPEFREGLLKCADSEDEIANIVERIFPIPNELAEQIKAPLPDARDTYYKVFEPFTVTEQLAIQADAELQGSRAWEAMLSDDLPIEVSEGLQTCMKLEQASSAYLYSVIGQLE